MCCRETTEKSATPPTFFGVTNTLQWVLDTREGFSKMQSRNGVRYVEVYGVEQEQKQRSEATTQASNLSEGTQRDTPHHRNTLGKNVKYLRIRTPAPQPPHTHTHTHTHMKDTPEKHRIRC
jgi:hypothetical protein